MTLKGLLLTSALTLPAFAGPALAQQSDTPCDDLSAMIEDGLPEGVSMTEQDLRAVVEDGDAEACETRLTTIEQAQADTDMSGDAAQAEADAEAEGQVAERERTTVQIDEERVVEGVVRLERESPQVDVEEGQANVTVRGGEPDVTVSQPRPEITVRHPQATVTMEMAQPTVTIDQPAPEIIITMPDPNVDVANAEPEVEVQQSEPNITVSQAPPQVDLDLRVVENADASGSGVQVEDAQSGSTYSTGEAQELQPLDDAQVQVTRSDPQVTYEQASNEQDGEATSGNVTIEGGGEPTVNFEQSEPNVEFRMTGEPQIQFNQSGEPQVTFQTAQSGEQDDQAQNMQGQDSQSDDMQSAETGAQDAQSDEMQSADAETDAAQSGEQSGDMQASETGGGDSQSSDMQMADDAEGTDTSEQSGDMQSADATAGTTTGPDLQVDGYEAVPAADISNDRLQGGALWSENNERIGDIEELITDEGTGLQRIVVGVGGFLGLGERQVALDLDEMQVMQSSEGDDVRIYTDMTREELENMERYEG
ncbi:PRC-barrel domain-containing protein [Roseivivax isoporae]|uniref:Uncharacterized protein n=1 Tax=Roseivivax isoporae LMG 25204 TaxID=1449351 RepID=X7FBT4_9RHOB|nr:PRC-barrel domain-containing protein [Roseivivax isoporae]ETX29504.1 hypothetical protein RISW2_23495 [Roseivivax isoporae LMG 25204]